MSEYFDSDLILHERRGMGGMAEVYRATLVGVGGFKKTVAVKRVLPNFASGKHFEAMFLRETKIVAQLQHPNIVQVFRNGRAGEHLYLVMEYIDGLDTSDLFDRCVNLQRKLPLEIGCHIISHAAMGLDYAHSCKDALTGESLKILHRDISPQNIMLSYSGEVKVVDFGIAKAANSANLTKSGGVRGKQGYLSPEQVNGKPTDHRSDIFSLGIIFYELLSGENLFQAENSYALLRNISEGIIVPIREHLPEIHPDLEGIVNKSLAKSPAKRYQNAGELHRDIARYLNEQFPKFVSQDFASFLQNVFKKEIAKDRKRRQLEDSTVSASKASERISKQLNEEPLDKDNSGTFEPGTKTGTMLIKTSHYKAILLVVFVNVVLISLILKEGGYLDGLSLRSVTEVFYPSEAPLFNGLVAWYDIGTLSETDGTKVTKLPDSSGMNNGIIQKNKKRRPVLRTKVDNNALSFNGWSNFLEAERIVPPLKNAPGLTVAFVAKSIGEQNQVLWSLREHDPCRNLFSVGFADGNNLRVQYGPKQNQKFSSPPVVAFSKFSSFIVTLDKTRVTIYQNGKLALDRTFPAPLNFREIGRASFGHEWNCSIPSRFFHGELAELLVYNKVLKQSERESLASFLKSKFGLDGSLDS